MFDACGAPSTTSFKILEIPISLLNGKAWCEVKYINLEDCAQADCFYDLWDLVEVYSRPIEDDTEQVANAVNSRESDDTEQTKAILLSHDISIQIQ